jgi:tetratricopeptide (TPR) repeat protein/ferredoxin
MKSGCIDRRAKKSPADQPIAKGATATAGMRKSTTSRWRAAVLIFVNLFMVAHFIQWWIYGQTISPIEPSETMHTLQKGAVNAGFIFFTAAILATIIFGRFVCGWGCHILALQDFCAWLLKKMGLTPKPFRSRLLVYVPLIAALYMFVWPTAYRFFVKPDSEPLFPTFTNHLVTTNFWETFPSFAVAVPFLFICGFMTVYFLGQKGFCTYACPYGGFFGLADMVSPGKIRVTDACNQCGHCTATCTSNVLVHAEVRDYKMVVDPGCMKCMDCISVCPNDALYFGFGIPTIAAPKSKKIQRNYSLTWPEEFAGSAVFLGSFLSVRGAYGLIPFLMALGWASVTTFLVLKVWRMLRTTELSFYRLIFKSAGKIRAAGWAFLVFSILWIGFNAHSGWIRLQETLGDRAFQQLQIPDELALAEGNPAPWLSPADREAALSGKKHLQAAANLGFFANGEALPKLAWFEYLTGNPERAAQLLGEAAGHQKGQGKALSLYYRGTILNRLGRFDEALKDLDAALAERDDLILARQEKGESLWQLGRKEEAVLVWTDALLRNARMALVANELAGAERELNRPDNAAAHEKQADQFTPDDPLYHWLLGLRLKSLGMTDMAEKHFQRAIQLDPSYQSRPR